MAKPTKIILDKQSDLILTNAMIVGASGIVKSDLPGLVDDLSNLDIAIDTEENARIAADAGLSSEISVERGRIDAILAGATADLDQFVEIVNFVNGIDMTNDQSLLTAVTDINASIDAEEIARIAGDAAGASALSAEIARATAAEGVLTTDLATETSARIAGDAAGASALSAEIDRATAAEGVLQTNITTEANERAAEDITLQGNIDIEATRAQLAETTIATNLATEIADRIAAVSAEEVSRIAGDAAGASALSAEIARATEAEGVLQSNIDTEKGRIDAILIGASANADNFAEIVAIINSVDTENDTAFAGYVLSNDAALAAEVSRAEAAESQLNSDLDAEVLRATTAEDVLTTNLDAEVVRATAAEAALTSALSAEEVSRIAGDAALQSSLNNEISDRLAADQSLQSALDAEVIRSTAALDAEVIRATAAEGVLRDSIDSEASRAFNAEAALQSALDAETTARIAGDAQLTEDLSTLQTYVNTTISDTVAVLTDDILAETARALEAEQILRDDLDAEIAARIAADEELDVRITDIISNTDLTAVDSFAEVVRDLTAEITRATDAESTLQDAIDTEVAAREAAIAEEHAHHTAAEELLTTNLDAEVVRATAAEEALDATKLDLAGGTMTGNIDMGNKGITNVNVINTITLTSETTYVDTLGSNNLSSVYLIANIDAQNTQSIENLPAPTNNGDATNKTYVDGADATLQSAIDVEKGRIDAILDGSDVDLDQFREVVDFVNSIDLTNDDALLNAVIGIENSISLEITDRTNADLVIQSNIDTLEGTLISELSMITASLNSEIDTRISDIATVEQSIDELSETVDSSVIEINDSIDSIVSDLSAEVTRATTAEAALTSAIDVEKDRIDAILSGSTVDLDQFAEVVSFVQSIDLENDDALLSAVTSITSSIDQEITDRESADLVIQSNIDTLEGTLISELSMITDSLNSEINNRISDIATVEQSIDELSETVDSSVIEINNSIDSVVYDLATETAARIADVDAEEARATAAEGVLQSNIDVEKARIDAILDGSDVDLDQFAEVVSFVQSIDLSNDDALLNAVTSINDAIDAEVAARIADVDAEEARATAAEAGLAADLSDLQTYVDTTVDSAIATLTSDLADETAARIADVDAEETRAIAAEAALSAALTAEEVSRIAGDAAGASALSAEIARATAAEGILQLNINTEANERAAEDITLQGNIDIEATRAQLAETTIATNLATEITDRIAAISAEEVARIAGDAAGASALSAEISRATAAEGVLQTNIDTEKSRIDAILIGASANADNFAEIVALINSVDTTNDAAFASYVLANDTALADEILARETADTILSDDISSEGAARAYADTVLQTNIDTEVARATAAEAALSAALSAEEVSRIAGDDALQSSLNNEISDRLAADQSLQSALDAESARAIAAEDVLTTNLAAEVTRATAAEAALATDFANIYSKKVAITGTANGTLTTFALNVHVRFGSEMIYVNGLLMEEGEDYTTVITSGKVSSIEFFVAPTSEMKVRAYGVC